MHPKPDLNINNKIYKQKNQYNFLRYRQAFYGIHITTASAWSKTKRLFIIPDSVTFIGDFAFSCCGQVADIKMSDNVTSMGIEAIFGTAVYNDMNNWDNDMFYLGKYLIEAGSVAGDINVRPGTVLVARGLLITIPL